MGSLKFVSQKTRSDFGQEPVPNSGFPTIPKKLGVHEEKKDAKLAFLEFGKDLIPTVLIFPGNALEILISLKKIPEQKDRTFPSMPNPRIWRLPGEGSKSPRFGFHSGKSGRSEADYGGEEAGNLGTGRGSEAGTPRPLGSLPDILGLCGIHGFRIVGGSGKIQGWKRDSIGDLPGKGEHDPLNGNSSRKIPPHLGIH